MADEIGGLIGRLRHGCQHHTWNDCDGSAVFSGTADVKEANDKMADAAAALERLQGELAGLYSGETAVLPHSREHAEHLYAVAIGCLKPYGIDPEARVKEVEGAVAAEREACAQVAADVRQRLERDRKRALGQVEEYGAGIADGVATAIRARSAAGSGE